MPEVFTLTSGENHKGRTIRKVMGVVGGGGGGEKRKKNEKREKI